MEDSSIEVSDIKSQMPQIDPQTSLAGNVKENPDVISRRKFLRTFGRGIVAGILLSTKGSTQHEIEEPKPPLVPSKTQRQRRLYGFIDSIFNEGEQQAYLPIESNEKDEFRTILKEELGKFEKEEIKT